MILNLPRLCAGFAIGWVALGASWLPAQPNIQISVPSDGKSASQSGSIMSAPRDRRDSSGPISAPPKLFELNPGTTFDPFAGAAQSRAASSAEAKRWQQLLDKKRNWTLSTPEEILGLQTPQKILGLPDEKTGDKLTAEEKYLQRQRGFSTERSLEGSRRANADLKADRSLAYQMPDELDSPLTRPDSSQSKNSPFSGQGFNPSPASPFSTRETEISRPASSWANPFDVPASNPKQTADQLAGMERFRALFDAPSKPEKPMPKTRTMSGASSPNPYMGELPDVNSPGHAFTTPQHSVGKPTGIKPLPGITAPSLPPLISPSKSSRLPPWLADPSKPFKTGDRQF